MTENQCEHRRFQAGSFKPIRCETEGVICLNEKWWCKDHSPKNKPGYDEEKAEWDKRHNDRERESQAQERKRKRYRRLIVVVKKVKDKYLADMVNPNHETIEAEILEEIDSILYEIQDEQGK